MSQGVTTTLALFVGCQNGRLLITRLIPGLACVDELNRLLCLSAGGAWHTETGPADAVSLKVLPQIYGEDVMTVRRKPFVIVQVLLIVATAAAAGGESPGEPRSDRSDEFKAVLFFGLGRRCDAAVERLGGPGMAICRPLGKWADRIPTRGRADQRRLSPAGWLGVPVIRKGWCGYPIQARAANDAVDRRKPLVRRTVAGSRPLAPRGDLWPRARVSWRRYCRRACGRRDASPPHPGLGIVRTSGRLPSLLHDVQCAWVFRIAGHGKVSHRETTVVWDRWHRQHSIPTASVSDGYASLTALHATVARLRVGETQRFLPGQLPTPRRRRNGTRAHQAALSHAARWNKPLCVATPASGRESRPPARESPPGTDTYRRANPTLPR